MDEAKIISEANRIYNVICNNEDLATAELRDKQYNHSCLDYSCVEHFVPRADRTIPRSTSAAIQAIMKALKNA